MSKSLVTPTLALERLDYSRLYSLLVFSSLGTSKSSSFPHPFPHQIGMNHHCEILAGLHLCGVEVPRVDCTCASLHRRRGLSRCQVLCHLLHSLSPASLIGLHTSHSYLFANHTAH